MVFALCDCFCSPPCLLLLCIHPLSPSGLWMWNSFLHKFVVCWNCERWKWTYTYTGCETPFCICYVKIVKYVNELTLRQETSPNPSLHPLCIHHLPVSPSGQRLSKQFWRSAAKERNRNPAIKNCFLWPPTCLDGQNAASWSMQLFTLVSHLSKDFHRERVAVPNELIPCERNTPWNRPIQFFLAQNQLVGPHEVHWRPFWPSWGHFLVFRWAQGGFWDPINPNNHRDPFFFIPLMVYFSNFWWKIRP